MKADTMISETIKPGYKRTDVGMIPEDWEVKRLGELFEITSSKRVFQREWRPEGIPFYRARELAVLSERGYVQNELFISKEMYEYFKRSYGVPQRGDMLVTGVGTLGKVYVVLDDHEFYFKDGNIIWYKISGAIVPDFLRQLYLTRVIIKQIADGSAGTTVGTYTIFGANNTLIPFPCLAEQRAIAEVLSDADALLEAMDQLIAKKRDIKQGAMQGLLTGRVRLPGFSGEWESAKLGDFGNCLRGVSYNGETDLFPHDTSESIRLLRANNLQNARLDLTDIQYVNQRCVSPQQLLQIDDIVICMANGSKDLVGKAARFDVIDTYNYTYGAFMGCFRISSEYALPIFISFLFQIPAYRDHIHNLIAGSSINNLKQSDIESVRFFVPPISEQRAIAQVLSDIDAEIGALEKRRAKLHALKQGMMQELLTGRTRLIEPGEPTWEVTV